MVYGIVELVNFAHGDVYMLGAFTALTTIGLMGANETSSTSRKFIAIGVAFVAAVAFTATANFIIERTAYRRLRNTARLLNP